MHSHTVPTDKPILKSSDFHVQLVEQRRAEEAAAAAAAEAAREAALQEAYEASLPDDIKERVVVDLEREVVSSMHRLFTNTLQNLNKMCHTTLNSPDLDKHVCCSVASGLCCLLIVQDYACKG
jgi:hypothetical protein